MTTEEIYIELSARQLWWCESHEEPVWVYTDGSWSCRWQLVVESGREDRCKLIPNVPESVLAINAPVLHEPKYYNWESEDE